MLISFVMPAYKAEFLKPALDSIVNQTNRDWELIVVDDCSPEDLYSVVKPYCEHYNNVFYYRNDENIGGSDLVGQWNHSISFAKGDWIVMASDDDMYDPRFCEVMEDEIKKYPNVDLFRSRLNQIDANGDCVYVEDVCSHFASKYCFLYDWLTARFCTCIGNYLFRRIALDRVGGFLNFPSAFGSDVATPVALSVNGVINTSEVLYTYRISGIHLSSSVAKTEDKLKGITMLYDWLFKLDYEEPSSEDDKRFNAIINRQYMYRKCIYDYYNSAVKFLPLSKLYMLRYCSVATYTDRTIILLRWIKNKLVG